MLTHTVYVVSKMDPLKFLFDKPALNGRISRWMVMLAEFDLKFIPQKSIKGAVVSDFLTDFPGESGEVHYEFPDEHLCTTNTDSWELYFDGASNQNGCGAGVILISPDKEHLPISVRLDFEATNNAAEYEACIIGLKAAIALNIKKLQVHGDSLLIINPISKKWKMQSEGLTPYQIYLETIDEQFDELEYKYLPRKDNQFADALAKLASMVNIPKELKEMPLVIEKRHEPAYVNARQQRERRINSMVHGHLQLHRSRGISTQHHKSSPYRPQMNGAVEAANKNIKTIVRKMSKHYRDWPNKLHFALWGYRTSVRTSTGATPYSLVYGTEAVHPIELELPSLRIVLESEIPEAEWVRARYEQLALLDEKRLAALHHVQVYQKKIARHFNKKVRPNKQRVTRKL